MTSRSVSATVSVGVGTQPFGVAVSPDGERAYVATRNPDSLSIIDTTTNTLAATISVGSAPADAVSLPSGSRVYVANSFANSVSVVDASTNPVVGQPITVGSGPYGLEPSSDGTRVYVANSGSSTLSVVDTATNLATLQIPVGGNPLGMAMSPDGARLYVVNYNSDTMSVIDTDPTSVMFNSAVATVSVGRQPYDVAVSPDGRRAYVTNSGDNTVSVIDVDRTSPLQWSTITTVSVGTQPYGVAMSPTGDQLLVVAYGANAVSVIDTSIDTVMLSVAATIPVGAGPRSVAFGPCDTADRQSPSPLPPPPPPQLPTVDRVGGNDRFATSVAMSRAVSGTSPSTVYVTSGQSFADALVAGSYAARDGGAILLVQRDRVPTEVLDEIRRLAPDGVVIVGGAEAVSPAVEQTLTATGVSVQRVAGSDRYATAAELSLRGYPAGTTTVYLVSGVDLAEATPVGVPATLDDGPVLLVHPDGIPEATALELARLRPERIVIVGSEAMIDASTLERLAPSASRVERVAGLDRLDTSVALSRSVFSPGVPVVFLAAADRVADSLTAVAHAGRLGGPVLLTEPTCLPASVMSEVTRLQPRRIITVGGTAALTTTIDDLTVC